MTDNADYAKGFIPRNFSSHPLGQLVCAPRFSMPLIPRSEWKDRIEEKTRNKSWLWDRAGQVVHRKNQEQLGWCHAAGPVGALEATHVAAGLPYKPLSIASVAGPTVNWANRGAYIFDDLRVMETAGVAELAVFPELTQDASLYTDAVRTNALKHRVKAMDLDTNNWDEIITAALADVATVYGINDWGHCVYGGTKLRWANARAELLAVNSWGPTWGPNGDGTLWIYEGGQHCPNEAYAIFGSM